MIRRSLALAMLASALGTGIIASGCQTAPEPRDLTSLRRSGESTFLCISPEGLGVPLSDCPQGARNEEDYGLTVGRYGYSLHSLVTQTLSAEVAVVRVAGGVDEDGESEGRVLDVDRSNPGVTPLRVAGVPTGIVTTPGGLASFVGISEVGLEGVFALPTSCIFEPKPGEEPRDRTSWPACSLPAAPGAIQMVLDPGDGSTVTRETCDGSAVTPAFVGEEGDEHCTADLSVERGDKGRRKLLVGMPSLGKVLILDAQDILNREPGSYDACHIEAELPLQTEVPTGMVQSLPIELRSPETGDSITYDEVAGTYVSRPAGMDQLKQFIYIADRGSPLVHRVDARDPCALVELPPLVATSYDRPERVVVTSRVAISPETPSGQQFVYAVDEAGEQNSSIVIFDVSPGLVVRTPVLREGSHLLPDEPPDRIEFAAAVKDVKFAALEQQQVDPATGTTTTGVLCDPDPQLSELDPRAQYRPTSDTEGAGPRVMRGLFGYALLSDGNLAVIDIEDYDEACRRPITPNQSSEMDFRGCSNDTLTRGYYTVGGSESSAPTVTEEVSCRAVSAHRVRSRELLTTSESDGIAAPSLRAFGQLNKFSRGLSVSRLTSEGKRKPILLGVDFDAPGVGNTEPATVYIGSRTWTRDATGEELVIDPNRAERVAPVLPFIEPRAYPIDDVVNATYEGALGRTRETGRLSDSIVDTTGSGATFTDPDTNFCSLGVQDEQLTREQGARQFALTGDALNRFVERHTDYVQVSNVLYYESDPYWRGSGGQCGADTDESQIGYDLCESVFGKGDTDELVPARDLRIVSATPGALEVIPRVKTNLTVEHMDLMRCCFPDTLTYQVRGGRQWIVRGQSSGFEHTVQVDPSDSTGACIFDTSPQVALKRGRAFELSSTKCEELDAEDPEACGVGLRTKDDVVCVYDATRGPVSVDGVGAECIFDGLTRRFAIYRGLEPSERDMSFAFEVTGGFGGMAISLTQDTSVVLPVSMAYVPTFDAMGVVDSQNQGLMMVDLVNSLVAQSFY